MKIILATPIYLHEIGGLSQYVKNLEQGLQAKGIETQVLSYNNFNKYPQPLRFLIYFISLFKTSKDCDLIYAFNLISCGFPAYLTSKLRRKRFFIRLGGDFLWERAVEAGRTNRTLKQYYKEPKALREKFWILIVRKILNSANKIIFTSNFQKEIYKIHYGVKENNAIVIPNPFPKFEYSLSISNNQSLNNYQLLYAGRFLKLKNLDVLIEIFNKVLKSSGKQLFLRIIGEGPEENRLRLKVEEMKLKNNISIEKSISHKELLREIQKSYLCVLPSFTDITPNFALDCIKLRKPLLLTKETEYFKTFKDNLIFIDPCDRYDIENKILYLLDKNHYSAYVEKIRKIPTDYSWDNIVKEHISLFKID
jgi:glycosyltransferase involved in cell wall biosynthesis